MSPYVGSYTSEGLRMGDVVKLGCITTLPLKPDDVLSACMGKLSEVVVVAWDKEDYLYLASSTSDVPNLVFLLEKAKQQLLDDPPETVQ